MRYLILGNGQNEQVSDRFCPILSGGEGGQLWSCQICSLEKIPLCMYVIDFSVRQLSNKKLSNKTTYIHTSIQTPQWPDKSLRLDGATKKKTNVFSMTLKNSHLIVGHVTPPTHQQDANQQQKNRSMGPVLI